MDVGEIDEAVETADVKDHERTKLQGHSTGNGVAYNLFAKVPTANRVDGSGVKGVGGSKIGKANLLGVRRRVRRGEGSQGLGSRR